MNKEEETFQVIDKRNFNFTIETEEFDRIVKSAKIETIETIMLLLPNDEDMGEDWDMGFKICLERMTKVLEDYKQVLINNKLL